MRICPNDKFIEIFAQRFHYFENPFYKLFALNLLFQDTSYSLALKYSSFLVLHFIIFISGSKSVKLAQKFRIFLKFLTLEGTLPLTFPYISPYLPHTPTHFPTPPLIPLPTSPLPPPTTQHTFLHYYTYPDVSLIFSKCGEVTMTKFLWRSFWQPAYSNTVPYTSLLES